METLIAVSFLSFPIKYFSVVTSSLVIPLVENSLNNEDYFIIFCPTCNRLYEITWYYQQGALPDLTYSQMPNMGYLSKLNDPSCPAMYPQVEEKWIHAILKKHFGEWMQTVLVGGWTILCWWCWNSILKWVIKNRFHF